ncbi:MAG: hypothetical protein AAFQ82_10115 [Myxococcota bacterium]
MTIELPKNAPMSEFQRYIHELESLHGWLDVDLVHTCFLMGEEMGELFRAVRDRNAAERRGDDLNEVDARVGEEIVDVLNMLLAVANRLNLDVERTFREKNLRNQSRRWDG